MLFVKNENIVVMCAKDITTGFFSLEMDMWYGI